MSLQSDGALAVNFLGREYEISSRGINPTDGMPVNVNNRSVLVYYTLSISGDYAAFSAAMERLGGVFNGVLKSGGYAWLLKALPKILLQIVYYEGDEEFPCEVQILFDKNAAHFMEFECLAFLEGCLVKAMIMTAKTGDTTGWV